MSINERENELFTRWKDSLPESIRHTFVTDGVVNEDRYQAATPKILFMLKEVNDIDGGGWCLREFLRDEGGRVQTWGPATRWVRGITSLPNEIAWGDLESVTEKDRIAYLADIAAINLKKTPGGHTVDRTKWWESVQRDKSFIKEQFLLYNADIVLCCGSDVSGAFSSVINEPGSISWSVTSRGVEFYEYTPKKFVIRFSHPAARVSPNLVYYGLVDAIREILGSN